MRAAPADRPLALTRAVSQRIAECELTHLVREPIDAERARRQHAAYEAALERLGCRVARVAPAPELPDSVFVEDAAVVLDGLAILTRPGAESRRGETAAVADALRPWLPVVRVEPPATLDGGDVLVADRTVYVGATSRTNAAAHAGLRAILEPRGYAVRVVPVRSCLHLKTAVTLAAAGAFLLNPDWVDPAAFPPGAAVPVDPAEPFAANVLALGGRVIAAAGFPRTRARLEALGLEVITVDLSELLKAEAGPTCCSVLLPADPAPGAGPIPPGAPGGDIGQDSGTGGHR